VTKFVLSISLALLPLLAHAQSAARFSVPVEYFKLPNGLKVVVSEDHTAPIVTVEVMYNIGFRSEPKGRTGFAHLFEHMMFQGSAQVKKMEHVALMQQAGGIVNGSTRLDYTDYHEVLPSNALELALWLEADRMRSLDISIENLKNQQNVVSEEVRVNVLNQPHGGFDWIEIWQRANTNWANAHNFYGDLADLEAATVEDVRSFFKTYYAPNNAVVVVAGDADPAEVRRLAEKHFGSIPRQPLPERPGFDEPPQSEERRLSREDKLARTPALAVAWHLPARMTKDFFAMSVLNPLIAGGESSRLYQRLVRQDRNAVSVVGNFNWPFPDDTTNWNVNGPMLYTLRVDYLNDKSAAQVLDSIEQVFTDIRTNGISESELAQAKTALRSAFLEDMEGGFMPLFGRANVLGAFALFDDDPRRINTILDELDKVTVADVKAAAARWFVKSNQTSIDSRPAAKPAAPGVER
jgi:predicted Zn-dependent peptidase